MAENGPGGDPARSRYYQNRQGYALAFSDGITGLTVSKPDSGLNWRELAQTGHFKLK